MAALPMIALVALMLTASLIFLMRRGIATQDAAAHIQLRTDFRQREDALVRALLAIVPNKAIGCMSADADDHAVEFTWSAIFDEAIASSNGGTVLSEDALATLGLGAARSANTANNDALSAAGLLKPLVAGAGNVVAGNTGSDALIAASGFGGKVPPTLNAGAVAAADALYPIISRSKRVATQGADNEYALSPGNYPLYNQVKFPNVRFGFANPGDYVVGKRNWWAFSVEYGSGSGLGTVLKKYVLSIYELPNQLPITASDDATVGVFGDGTIWGGVNLEGNVFADRLTTDGAFGFGNLIGRDSVAIGAQSTANGEFIGNNFDDLGVRETLALRRVGNATPVALSSNAGKMAFVSLKRGADFYTEAGAPIAGALSDTTWDDYTRGPDQCAVKVTITATTGGGEPTDLSITYLVGGARVNVPYTLRRYDVATANADFWADEAVPSSWIAGAGANLIPFQGQQANGATIAALKVYPNRLNAWLLARGADPIAVNSSVYVTLGPDVPAGSTAVILTGANDLSTYTNGFALVTNLRCHTEGDVNQVAIAAPNGAGFEPGHVHYPPFALFTPDFQVGTAVVGVNTTFNGQISSVGNSEGDANPFNPLDFRSGQAGGFNGDQIAANLTTLISPAELPPVLNMNWLLTIEEIH